MNTLEMWMDYVDDLSVDDRVLLFDFPQELRTDQALVTGMHAFFEKLGIKEPVFIGASGGGMVARYTYRNIPARPAGSYPSPPAVWMKIPSRALESNTASRPLCCGI